MENQTSTITIQAKTDNARVESLLESLIAEQSRTNALLSEMVKNPGGIKPTMSHSEAAAFLNVTKQTLYDWVSEKKIPFIKSGSKNLFKRDQLEEWMKDRSCKARER